MTASCSLDLAATSTDPLLLKCAPALANFLEWCDVPATSGPSNRGDPHLTTTNGIDYDFQAAGEFTALRNSSTAFELQTRQSPVTTSFTPGANAYTGLASCVSLNTAVAVRLGNHRVTYQPPGGTLTGAEKLELRVDGELVILPKGGLNLGNGNLITTADSEGAFNIIASDGTHVIVTPNFWASEGYWYLNIEVMNSPAREGTMGHILSRDWLPLAPNGSSFGPAPTNLLDKHNLLNMRFADAWRVTDKNSLFDYEAGTSTADFTNRNWPSKPGDPCTLSGSTRPPVKPMKPEAARELCSVIKDKKVFENCVFDVTTTGEAGFVRAYQRSLRLRESAITRIP
jgi:lysyl endopeptidase